ncbi:hypothetical protein NQT69_08155 [Pseudoalteromonas shioyasakiensis]|uniref:hypothetical protein n=1 Tax=Pseudoalteromonas shioyasakiensis TaxID=1190813 RepID=UPI0021197425|nr:hypothetical protein [Pseudoalteromonas shioyasakiensis]MCQ8877965.1 hypothetical protein [Pseudoalteromonas shioyasakiensis]
MQFLCILFTGMTGYLCWRWFRRAHPLQGTFVLDGTNCHFINAEQEINGMISSRSRAYQHCIWLNLIGFSQAQWLIINANGLDEESFIRLKRAVLASAKR